jgi:SAM-dependent methyltransferase
MPIFLSPNGMIMNRDAMDKADAIYDQPAYYDILATPGTASECNVLQSVAEEYGKNGRHRRWLEPACGTGRYLRLLAARGQPVLGFDISAPMLDYARRSLKRRGLQRSARVFQADMRDFEANVRPQSIDFAFNTFSSVRHLMSDTDLLAHLGQMAHCLKHDAVYLMGLSFHQPHAVAEEDVWTANRGRCHITLIQNYLPPGASGKSRRIETVICHMMVERPSGVTHLDETYHLRTWTEPQWLKVLQRSALQRLAVLDSRGRPRGDRVLPYHYEVLGPR